MPTGESHPVATPPRPHPAPGPGAPAVAPTTLRNGVTPYPPVELAPVTPPPAPADLLPPPTRRQRALWYGGAVVLTIILLAGGLRLDRTDLRAPFAYDNDALLIMPMVRGTIENGTHWRNARMGFPGVLELYDFPVVDHLHFAVIWLLGRVIGDWALVFNLYYLLTWPLATLTAMAALRELRLSLPMAAAGGILFAFLPYHYLRGESHYFLAAYWVVPLSWLPALAVCKGDLPFFRRDPAGGYRLALKNWATLGQVALAAATASAGAYYAFFACALYGFAGAYGWVAHRTWKAAAAAAVLVGLVGLVGVANHAPSFGHVAKYGRNTATERFPEEAETYGLKIIQLILPIDGHNLTAFGQFKSSYYSDMRPLVNENSCAALGVVGSVGLLGLLAALLLRAPRGWPFAPLAALAGFIVLFALVGGFGAVFNMLVFDQVRCHNRFSVYLAFICLFAALWPLDRFLITDAGWTRRLRYPAIAGVVALGVADQTPTAWYGEGIIADTTPGAARFYADRRFFARIEEVMPAGATVFMLPYVQYPEVPPLHRMDAYEHARGYLHTDTLVWSYGVMKNREVDGWQASAAGEENPAIMLLRVVARGFDGLFVDTRGYAVADRNRGDALIAAVRHAAEANGRVKLPVVTHENGEQVFLDLRPYRDWLRAENPAAFERWAAREREWMTVTWLGGFLNPGAHGEEHFRWGYRKGVAVIDNPTDRTRTFDLTMSIGVLAGGEFRLRIAGPGLTWVTGGEKAPWADEVSIERREWSWGPARGFDRTNRTYRLEIPPGRHTVRFHCLTPDKFLPPDSRPTCYILKNIKFEEVERP